MDPKAETKAAEKEPAKVTRVKDDRRIARGVLVPDGQDYKNFATEDDHDALEEALTKEQVEKLVADGSLEGKWHGKAKEARHLKSRVRPVQEQTDRAVIQQLQDRIAELEKGRK